MRYRKLILLFNIDTCNKYEYSCGKLKMSHMRLTYVFNELIRRIELIKNTSLNTFRR